MGTIPTSAFALFAILAVLSLPSLALADDVSDGSDAGNRTLPVGTLISTPNDVPGKPVRGIPLRHTHSRICDDEDGKTYDLAVDDVFAAGYEVSSDITPPPLNSIQVGQRLEACGPAYAGGKHWVHTNCGDDPTARYPSGWLKLISANGVAGSNLEDSQKYRYRWPKGRSSIAARITGRFPSTEDIIFGRS